MLAWFCRRLPALRCFLIVLYQQEETLDQVVLALAMHAARAAYQTGWAGATWYGDLRPGSSDQSLYHRGDAALLQRSGHRRPSSRWDRLVPVIFGHVRPDQIEHRVGAVLSRKRDIADHEADHLPDLTRHRRPQPQAGRHPDTEFLDLDSVASAVRAHRDALLLELGLARAAFFYARPGCSAGPPGVRAGDAALGSALPQRPADLLLLLGREGAALGVAREGLLAAVTAAACGAGAVGAEL